MFITPKTLILENFPMITWFRGRVSIVKLVIRLKKDIYINQNLYFDIIVTMICRILLLRILLLRLY